MKMTVKINVEGVGSGEEETQVCVIGLGEKRCQSVPDSKETLLDFSQVKDSDARFVISAEVLLQNPFMHIFSWNTQLKCWSGYLVMSLTLVRW